MKRYILILVVLFAAGQLYAQKEKVSYVKKGEVIEAVFYNDEGNIIQQGYYNLNGKLQGTWTTFNAEGKKLAVAQYENGKRVGKWFFWSDNLLKEVDFKDSQIKSVVEWHDGTRIAVRD